MWGTEVGKITSLEHRRKAREAKSRKEALEPDARLRELESDVGYLIDLNKDLEERLYNQEKYLKKLVRLLRQHVK